MIALKTNITTLNRKVHGPSLIKKQKNILARAKVIIIIRVIINNVDFVI
jgi:hypothetical protein